MNDAISRPEGYTATSHDEIRQGMLGIDINRLGIGGGMAEGLHGKIGREAQTGKVLEFIASHGTCRVLTADGGHPRLAVGARPHAFHAAGAPDHFLGQCIALVRIRRLFGFPEQVEPGIDTPLPQENVAIIGLRSVDNAERAALQETNILHVDMREIDETGIAKPLSAFLDRVTAAGGMLHVSLDVDFLDPAIAPAVGTTVPGGATIREGHLVMEMLHDDLA